MATKLNSAVERETAKTISNRAVIITIAPCGAQSEARVGLRLKGKRTQYTATVSDLYRVLALWHGQREVAAKRDARKNGVPWKRAKKVFLQNNSIHKTVRARKETNEKSE